MKQRNGRIDRKLQPQPEVFCHYFFYKQRPEDRILAALVRKTDTIKRELGSLAQVVDVRLAETLAKRGIRRDTIGKLEFEIEAADIDKDQRQVVEEELEVARERQEALLKQKERLQDLLAESQKSIGFHKDQFQATLACALSLMAFLDRVVDGATIVKLKGKSYRVHRGPDQPPTP